MSAEIACPCARCVDARSTTPLRGYMILCPKCGKKRCPHAVWHGYTCARSNGLGRVPEPARPDAVIIPLDDPADPPAVRVSGSLDAADPRDARIAELEAELVATDEVEQALWTAMRGRSDGVMRACLKGPMWDRLWGPGLEELGRVVDAACHRADSAEAERDALRTRLPVDGSHMPSIVDTLEDEVQALRAQAETLRKLVGEAGEMLSGFELMSDSNDGLTCPTCECEEEPHTSDCEMAGLLRRLREAAK